MADSKGKPLVIITGASSGIGEETAKLFSKLGHPLLLLARRVNKLKSMNLPDSLSVELDVTDRQAFKDAIILAEKEFGPTDCLVNNAGVMLLGQVAKQDPDEWKKMFDVNVMGLLNGIHMVVDPMIQRGRGTIINIGSIAGRKTFPNHSAYCGSKFAVHAIGENLREEVSQSNVRVITIAPGAVETELLDHTTSGDIKDGYKSWKRSIGGAIHPKDVSNAILFAYQQPQSVCVREIVLAPTKQDR